MKRFIQPARLAVAGMLAALAALPLASVAHAGTAEPTVPGVIAVEDGHKLFLVGHAVGVQIYRCDAIPGGYKWNFVAPRADVFDDHGKLLMTHFAGPRWRAKDGSQVVGQRVDGVTVDPSAIQWLLLSATASPDEYGDRLAGTTFIQRIATVGGMAPDAATCNPGVVGTIEEVPYTADYTFWKDA
jgi:Protein of unknown function (DUF3455)